ncbi:hypothetical protein RvY_07744 [Ramazzottius varieornatus]|uniref:Nuclear receptor domain-containing protein n=1 Tax=Ramazzottius varieornatus TaxID=947166 RepID=A0A1D1V3C1_RAMVA|nr:hypothetical protein RvY_07744 [Ramazzottius varieornatus]
MEAYGGSSGWPLVKDSCKICDGPATGVHYGVVSCEGCKAFFKRGLKRSHEYKCYLGGSCQIAFENRGRCKLCRFEKCVAQGMNLSAVKLGRIPKSMKKAARAESAAFRSSGAGHVRIAPAPPKGEIPFLHQPLLAIGPYLRPAADRARNGNFGVWKTRHVNRDGSSREEPSSSGQDSDDDPEDTHMNPSRKCSTVDSVLSEASCLRNPPSMSEHAVLMKVPCLSPDDFAPESLEIVPGQSRKFFIPEDVPFNLQKHWALMKEQTGCIRRTISAVTHALGMVYADQIRERDTFMEACLNPQSPNFINVMEIKAEFYPVEDYIRAVQHAVGEGARRAGRFASLIPGFPDLDPSDRAILVRDRWFVFYLIQTASHVHNNEFYYTVGAEKFHWCRYWAEKLLEPNLVDLVFAVTDVLNELELSVNERHVLLALSLFKCDEFDPAENDPYMQFLYCHFLEALVFLLGPRRAVVLERLEKLIRRFTVFNHIHRENILHLDLTRMPFRAAESRVHLDVTKLMTDDDLAPANVLRYIEN